jgi:hypothetical protein
MSEIDRTEEALIDDLASLGERLRDEKFCTELYRALAGGHLTKDGRAVAPSWRRAEEMVNRLRTQLGFGEPLTLAQTGGEGDLSDDVAHALRQLGWEWSPRDTSTHDPAHRGSPPSPPPPDAGERHAPVSDSHAWEREAHEEAEASRLRRPDAPAESLPGTGAGGGEAPRVGGS